MFFPVVRAAAEDLEMPFSLVTAVRWPLLELLSSLRSVCHNRGMRSQPHHLHFLQLDNCISTDLVPCTVLQIWFHALKKCDSERRL